MCSYRTKKVAVLVTGGQQRDKMFAKVEHDQLLLVAVHHKMPFRKTSRSHVQSPCGKKVRDQYVRSMCPQVKTINSNRPDAIGGTELDASVTLK